MRVHWLTTTVLAVLFLFNSAAFAQTATGTILGTVEDQSRAVIPGASVTITNVDTGVKRTVVTDSAGRYQVPTLIPGNYEIQAQAEGFQTEIRKGVQLTVGSEIVIRLTLAVGEVQQTAVVTAEAPLVETTTSAVSNLVGGEAIRDLPLNGRSFDQLIALNAAAPTIRFRRTTALTGKAATFSVGGARQETNQFVMDGIELVGAGSTTTLPGGVLGTNMGVDAVREFSLVSSNSTAAYGKKGGGVVNIATRSGTNQLHGSAFEFLRNDNLDARNFFDRDPKNPLKRSSPPEFRRNQFGGSLGGPLRRDKAFFFGTFEGLRETLGLSNIALVPDLNARQGLFPDPNNPGQLIQIPVAPQIRPYLTTTFFPLPNGRNFGDGAAEALISPTQPSRQDFFLIRGDYTISEKDSLMGRYNFSNARRTDPETNGLFESTDASRDQVATVQYTRSAANAVNTLRLAFIRAAVNSDSLPAGSNTIDPSLYFLPGAKTVGKLTFEEATGAGPITETGTSQSAERFFVFNTYDVSDQIYYYRGAHSLQFGGRFQRLQHNEDFGNSKRGQWLFNGFQDFLRNRPELFRAPDPKGGSANKAYRQNYFALYAQDDYKVLPNLTLNLGVRYEVLTVPTEVHGRISNFRTHFENGLRIVDTNPTLGDPFFQSNRNVVAPRVGFAWDPFNDTKTAIRGGFGMYYDQVESAWRFFTASNVPFFGLVNVPSAPFPRGFEGGSAGTLPLAAPDGIDFNLQLPTRLSWNLSIQRQVTTSTSLRAGYVGSRSYHLERQYDANGRIPHFDANGVKFFAGGPRKNPAVDRSRIFFTDSNSFYHSLQLDFNQRLSRGLRFGVSYAFSKNIDDATAWATVSATGTPATQQDPDNLKADHGLASFDVRNNLITNFTYDLPAMRGAAGLLLGGWQLGGIITLSDGPPFSATSGARRANDGARTNAERPDLKPGANNNPVLGGPDRYFDPTMFAPARQGYYGNLGRNTIIGPGVASVDMTLKKSFSVTERLGVDFRAEFFNLFNRANFGVPDGILFNNNLTLRGAAGFISDTTTTSRQIQFALKVLF